MRLRSILRLKLSLVGVELSWSRIKGKMSFQRDKIMFQKHFLGQLILKVFLRSRMVYFGCWDKVQKSFGLYSITHTVQQFLFSMFAFNSDIWYWLNLGLILAIRALMGYLLARFNFWDFGAQMDYYEVKEGSTVLFGSTHVVEQLSLPSSVLALTWVSILAGDWGGNISTFFLYLINVNRNFGWGS